MRTLIRLCKTEIPNGDAAMIIFTSVIITAMIVYVRVNGVNGMNSSYGFCPVASSTVSEEAEARSVARLRVEDKDFLQWGTIGFYRQYYLVLSNDLCVRVSKAQYDEYRVGESYDFEIVETTTVVREMALQE